MRLIAPLLIVLGAALQALTMGMLMTAGVAVYFNSANTPVYLYCALFYFLAGALAMFTGLPYRPQHLLTRQLFLVTGGTWLLLPIFACLPLLTTSIELTLADAVFETVSGFTTTGSTVITGLDTLAPDILVWRSFMQWLGGVGFICMAVALLPFLRIGGMRLFQTESSHWSDDNAPRARHLVTSIMRVYVLLTLMCILAYQFSGMDAFDSFNHALTTVATGGFSTSDASFANFSFTTQWVAVVFMISGSLPFMLYTQVLNGNLKTFFGNSQVRTFLLIAVGLSIAVSIEQYLVRDIPFAAAITRAAFNITSIMSTTGYASDDYTRWGSFTLAIVFFATFIGGCSGSTSGGTKVFRLQLFFALLKEQLLRTVHPKVTRTIFYNGKQIKSEIVTALVSYFFVMLICLVVITIGLSLTNLDLVTSLSGASTVLMNVGPGLGDIIGPAGNFSSLADPAKWLLSAGMLLGRLEFLTLLILFTASFWRA